MRLLGGEPGPLRRLVPWLVALGVLIVIGALTVWGRQQDAARQVAEARAEVAESQLVAVEASLTSIARTSAAETATAQAIANEPQDALRRALSLVFEAYKDPSDAKLRALSDAFSPDALSFERGEAEHLISGGLHLAGATPPDIQVTSSSLTSPTEAQIVTHEVWTYDEVDAQNRPARCFHEASDQTYTLRRVGAGWLVETVKLDGPTHRTDC